MSRFRHAFPSTVVLLVTMAACAAPRVEGTPPATERPMRSTGFELHSTSFAAGASIPARFTCDGDDGSPDLGWSGAPDGTAEELVLP